MVTNQSRSAKKKTLCCLNHHGFPATGVPDRGVFELVSELHSSELGPNCRHPDIHTCIARSVNSRYSSNVHALQYPLECYTIHSHLLAMFFPRVHSPIAASGALETLIKAAKSRKGSKRQTWNEKNQPELELPCIWVLIISSPRCEMAGVAQCPRATPLVAPQNNCSTGLVWQCQRAQSAMVPEPHLSGLNFMAESMPQDVSISLECWNAPVPKPSSNGGTIRQNCKTSPNPLLINEFGSNAFKCSDSTITKDVKNSNKTVAG